MDLFSGHQKKSKEPISVPHQADKILSQPIDLHAPLASRMRPRTLEEFVGQEHLLGEGKLLKRIITADRLTSLVLYGPPGSGKTTLALVISRVTGARFKSLNAVAANVQDIRAIIDEAKYFKADKDQRT